MVSCCTTRSRGEGRPPLVRIEHFTIAVPVLAILRKPIHVNSVTLDRLEIFLPKRRPAGARRRQAASAIARRPSSIVPCMGRPRW